MTGLRVSHKDTALQISFLFFFPSWKHQTLMLKCNKIPSSCLTHLIIFQMTGGKRGFCKVLSEVDYYWNTSEWQMIAIKAIDCSFPLDSNKWLGLLMVCHYSLMWEHTLLHKESWHGVPGSPVDAVSHARFRTAKDSILFDVQLKSEKSSHRGLKTWTSLLLELACNWLEWL